MRAQIGFVGLIAAAAIAAVIAGGLEGGRAGPLPTQVVTRFDDPPPGLCQPGDCSLREAVNVANTQAGPQLIVLEAGTYNLSINGRLEDGALTGDIDIKGNLSIIGAGMDETTIDANGTSTHDRAFDIHQSAQVVIADMRITDGLLEVTTRCSRAAPRSATPDSRSWSACTWTKTTSRGPTAA